MTRLRTALAWTLSGAALLLGMAVMWLWGRDVDLREYGL